MSSRLDEILGLYKSTTLIASLIDGPKTRKKGFQMSDEQAKAEIKSLMHSIIGEDESEIIHQRLSDEYAEVRNDLRAKLRNKLEEL